MRFPIESIISIPLVRDWVDSLPEDDPRREMVPLFLDLLNLDRRAEELGQICLGLDGFPDWTCCEEHRRLRVESDSLRERERATGHRVEDAQVGSEHWWRTLGFDYPGPATVVTVCGSMTTPVVTYLSLKLARESMDSFFPDDRRRVLFPLYFGFLDYQRRVQQLNRRIIGVPTVFELMAQDGLDQRRARLARAASLLVTHRSTEGEVLSQEWWQSLVMLWRDDAIIID